ncbi:MAG: putative metal-binding motif-containing protein [Sandaracinaceae bacterium]|nr:putative metal-binding motif-containing protein [Myxococcales bacterium]MCB9659031.1 putative metal-binding motif-containing protein [Sandaracinaceae bacterium]
MRTLVLVSVALLVAACQGGGPVVVDGGRDLGPMDLGARDAGDPCSRSEDCEDGVACTRDVCDGRGVCVHTPDPLSCDDGVFCNGAEVCDPNAGCVAGALRDCNDRNVCTLDRCDEGRGMCLHLPRDFDNDGEADARCAGGTDCDDADPLRGTLQAELCSDGLDNDCDLSIDEAVCGRPPHDQCEDALDVSAGGLFDLSTAGARDDYGALCSGPAREVVARFVLDDARDVTLRADAAGSTQVELRSGCGGGTVLRCDTGSPGEVRRRALPAGTYFVFVASSAGSVQLSVAFDPPTTQPSNEDCGSARTVIPPFAESGSFVGTVDDLTLSCGQPLAGDLVYAFEVPAGPPQDVVVAFAATSTTDAVRFSLRSTCSDASSELGCVRGSPAGGRFRSLAPGPYVLVVEGPAEREVDFAIDVRLEPGTTAPPGDSCAAPIDTPLEQIVHGTLADKRDAIQTPCGFFYRDAVHRFVLSEPRDVSIDLLAGTNGGAFVFGALGDTCEAMLPTTDYCVGGAPALLQRLALPAGEHFVVVEAPGTPTYQLEIHTAAPTSVVDAAGNDTCADAIVIPSQSSVVYRGDTSTLANDVTSIYCGSGARSPDATFLLELTEATVVRLSTAGSSFDTTLLVFLEGAACSNFPYACDDDSGPGGTSSIERELPAGRYHVVVDGFGGHSAGPYVLRVDRGPFPP